MPFSMDVFFFSILFHGTIFMLGTLLGSFASAISYRIQIGESWSFKSKGPTRGDSVQFERSKCPNCHHQLAWYDLIPFLSWISMAGRCRYCRQSISWRYPLIEATGGTFLLVFFLLGHGWLFMALYLVSLPFFLSFILLAIEKGKKPPYIVILSGINGVIFLLNFFQGFFGL